MEITVLQENLLKGLSVVSKFLPSKSVVATIVNSVFLKAEKGNIILLATNLETTIEYKIPGKIEKEGETLLPAKTILPLVSSLGGKKVILVKKEGGVVVECGKNIATVRAIQGEFPLQKKGEKGEKVEFTRNALVSIEERVGFASSSDSSRAELTGILLEKRENGLRAVATDGFRLSLLRIEKKDIPFESIIIPSGMFGSIASLLTEKEKKVTFEYSKKGKRMDAIFANGQLSSQLIAGTFPEYEKILPKNPSIRIAVGRGELLRAVKIASIFARETSNIVRFDVTKDNLVVSANSPHVGENKSTLSAKTDGDDISVAFNYRFILDFLSSSEEGEVIFKTNGPLQPGLFQFEDDMSFYHVIMPVRLQGGS